MHEPDVIASTPEGRFASLGPVRTWILHHDRSLLFAVFYIGLTILLSVFISYFWLLAVVGVHVVLEWLKKGYLGYRPGLHRTAWTLWDTKFDLALVFLAFTLLSYTGIHAGVAGAQSASRVGLLGGRMAALSGRMAPIMARLARLGALLRPLGIKAVDLFFSARVFLFRKADMARAKAHEGYLTPTSEIEEEMSIPAHLPWQRGLTGGAWFALIVIGFNLVAVLVSPLITDHSYVSLLQSLGAKLHPWPS